jgi:hypothetical protein
MSAKRFGRLGKILTGVFATVVAPVLANMAAQQVGDWQQTLKYLLENQTSASTADWNRPVPESVGVASDRFTAENAEKSNAILHCVPPRSLRSPR